MNFESPYEQQSQRGDSRGTFPMRVRWGLCRRRRWRLPLLEWKWDDCALMRTFTECTTSERWPLLTNVVTLPSARDLVSTNSTMTGGSTRVLEAAAVNPMRKRP